MNDHTLYPAWGQVTPDFWAPTADGARPAELGTEQIRTRLIEVGTAAESGHPQQAVTLATSLETDVVAQYGEAHLHTVQVREVRGYLAALTGDHASGLGWYLHCARLRVTVQGRSHPDVSDATLRAYRLWRQMPPGTETHRLGAELLSTVTDLHGANSQAAARIRADLNRPALAAAPQAS